MELARRYLVINHDVTFDSIPMAYDIFGLRHVQRVSDGARFHWHARRNGESAEAPRVGSLLIWEPRGYFKGTGHVAVIVGIQVRNLCISFTTEDVHPGSVYEACSLAMQAGSIDIVEQNVFDSVWPLGQEFSRRLKAGVVKESGAFYIEDSFRDTRILGWMTLD